MFKDLSKYLRDIKKINLRKLEKTVTAKVKDASKKTRTYKIHIRKNPAFFSKARIDIKRELRPIEIKKINNQISWGISLQEALIRFSRRFKKSMMVKRVTRILIEAYSSGGDIIRTMEATANDIETIREAEKESSNGCS